MALDAPSQLLSRDYTSVWHPYGRDSDHEALLPITHGAGALLFTEDGRAIIDAISSWWVNLHGHAHPALTEAIARQSTLLSQAIFGSCTHEPAVTLAERLLALLPANHQCVFYSDDGSTAVEVALKLAMQYWHNNHTPRTRFLALEGAYHGDTFGAMSVSERGVFTNSFGELLFSVDLLPFPGEPSAEDSCLAALDAALRNEPVAALIVEPLVQGAAGMRMYRPEILDEMIARVRSAGALVIFDEVMTGFGRTGHLFACQQTLHQPDLICLSKGITGGILPLGVTTMTGAIREACRTEDPNKTFFHGHSFTGNALSCACALASLDLLLSPACTAARERITERHAAFLGYLRRNYPTVASRHHGTILAVDFPHEVPTGYIHPLRHYLLREFLSDDILLRPLGNTVYVIPPYCITDEQLYRIYESMKRVLAILSGSAPFTLANKQISA